MAKYLSTITEADELVRNMNEVYDKAIKTANTDSREYVELLGSILKTAATDTKCFGPNFYAQLLEDVRSIYANRFCRKAEPVSAPVQVPVAAPSLNLDTYLGTFTVEFDNGEYETIRIKKGTGNFDGRYIASFLSGADNDSDYTGFAFINPDGTIKVWSRFSNLNGSQKQAAVRVIISLDDVSGAREAYAMRSGKCSRCGRTLTVPASLHRGMGPECAKIVG